MTENVNTSDLVGEAGPDCCLDALLQVGIVEDDGRVFPAQLEGQPLTEGGAALSDDLCRGRASSEGDKGHLWMGYQSIPRPRAGPKHDVHHPGGHACKGAKLLIFRLPAFFTLPRLTGSSDVLLRVTPLAF